VHVADALACFIDKPSNGDGNPAELVSSEALTILDYTPEKLLHYRDRTLKNFEMVNAMFRL